MTGGPKAIVPRQLQYSDASAYERLGGIGTKGMTAEVVGNQIGNHLDGRGIVVYNEYDEAVE